MVTTATTAAANISTAPLRHWPLTRPMRIVNNNNYSPSRRVLREQRPRPVPQRQMNWTRCHRPWNPVKHPCLNFYKAPSCSPLHNNQERSHRYKRWPNPCTIIIILMITASRHRPRSVSLTCPIRMTACGHNNCCNKRSSSNNCANNSKHHRRHLRMRWPRTIMRPPRHPSHAFKVKFRIG
jgi:hypothetical protein